MTTKEMLNLIKYKVDNNNLVSQYDNSKPYMSTISKQKGKYSDAVIWGILSRMGKFCIIEDNKILLSVTEMAILVRNIVKKLEYAKMKIAKRSRLNNKALLRASIAAIINEDGISLVLEAIRNNHDVDYYMPGAFSFDVILRAIFFKEKEEVCNV
jgi:hypothetical protein